MSSDSGYELGKELHFDYALVPHAGSWQEAGVYRDALEFNQPLLAHTADRHAGRLPQRWGLLQVAPQNVVVSALKNGPDGTAVLRIFETTGKDTQATIRFAAQLARCRGSQPPGRSGCQAAACRQRTAVEPAAFEIKTIKAASANDPRTS